MGIDPILSHCSPRLGSMVPLSSDDDGACGVPLSVVRPYGMRTECVLWIVLSHVPEDGCRQEGGPWRGGETAGLAPRRGTHAALPGRVGSTEPGTFLPGYIGEPAPLEAGRCVAASNSHVLWYTVGITMQSR